MTAIVITMMVTAMLSHAKNDNDDDDSDYSDCDDFDDDDGSDHLLRLWPA